MLGVGVGVGAGVGVGGADGVVGDGVAVWRVVILVETNSEICSICCRHALVPFFL